MKKRSGVPKFKNEDEEREFWAHIDLADYFEAKDLRPVSFPNLKPSSRAISIRLPEAMLMRLKEQTNELQVPYQALIKQWRGGTLHKGTHLWLECPKMERPLMGQVLGIPILEGKGKDGLCRLGALDPAGRIGIPVDPIGPHIHDPEGILIDRIEGDPGGSAVAWIEDPASQEGPVDLIGENLIFIQSVVDNPKRVAIGGQPGRAPVGQWKSERMAGILNSRGPLRSILVA